MEKAISFLKKKKVILTSLLIVFIASQATVSGTFAYGPRFNFMENDYETLRLANATAGETSWHDPVSADYGDRISFNVYYHNGMEETYAHNTRIRVNLPLSAGTKLISTANLWADNANLVTDTGTVNINGSTPAVLEYISGSTLWYPNQGLTPKPEPVHLSDGITESGVNIGDVKGCWEYSGFVVFQAKVVKVGKADLDIEKYVKNITSGQSEFVKQNTANPGDQLKYKIVITNPGNDTAKNVMLKDVLPNKVSYTDGTLERDGQTSGLCIFCGFQNIGNLASGASTTFTFKAKVASSGFAEGTTKLVNVAKTYADGISQINSDAATCVSVSPEPEPDLTITKYVKNITKGDVNYLKEGTAWPNDILEYKISFSNPGNAIANDVIVKDILPKYVSYISNSTSLHWSGAGIHPADVDLPDGITDNGVSLGNLDHGRSGYILFRVKVASCPPVGVNKLINLAKIWAQNVSEKHDTAKSVLTVSPPPEPVVVISKLVKNITKGETRYYDENSAFPGDILEYKITFTNTGDVIVTGAVVKDVLPAGVEFVSGSASLYVSGSALPMSDEIIGVGVSLADLNPGKSGYFTLRVKAKTNLNSGDVIVNTGHIYADCDIHEQDSAKTIIKGQPIRIIITQEQVMGKKLVSTGTPIGAIALFTLLSILGTLYIVRQKRFKKLQREAVRRARIS